MNEPENEIDELEIEGNMEREREENIERENLENAYNTMMAAYEEFKNMVHANHPNFYDRWKAGGFLIDTNIVSYYPLAEEVLEEI